MEETELGKLIWEIKMVKAVILVPYPVPEIQRFAEF